MSTVSTIEDNAALSIALAVEDYESGDPRRTISALRNMTAGLLLLFKMKLLELSPADSHEVLIKSAVEPQLRDGKLIFVGKGNKTVDRAEIEARFKALGIKADWKRTQEIVNVRNDIEHYRSNVSITAMREVFAKAFFVIDQFCKTELKRQPVDFLGTNVWKVFLEEGSFIGAIIEANRVANAAIQWQHADMVDVASNFSCAKCGSGLLRVVDPSRSYDSLVYNCLVCGQDNSFDELIGPALSESYAGENYIAFKDAGESYTEDCDNCWHESYVPLKGYCVVCGDSPFIRCKVCGTPYHHGHYCQYCEHIAEKKSA